MYKKIAQQKRPNSKFAKVGPLSDLVKKAASYGSCTCMRESAVQEQRAIFSTYEEDANECKKASSG
eukprot:72805-Ditylum_brightwellii.AAC.1